MYAIRSYYALMEGLDMGSDHDVFFEGSWRIPGLYLHDWPDRYIHTNFMCATPWRASMAK